MTWIWIAFFIVGGALSIRRSVSPPTSRLPGKRYLTREGVEREKRTAGITGVILVIGGILLLIKEVSGR